MRPIDVALAIISTSIVGITTIGVFHLFELTEWKSPDYVLLTFYLVLLFGVLNSLFNKKEADG